MREIRKGCKCSRSKLSPSFMVNDHCTSLCQGQYIHNMCVYVYTHIGMYQYVHIDMCVYVCTCVRAYAYIDMCMYHPISKYVCMYHYVYITLYQNMYHYVYIDICMYHYVHITLHQNMYVSLCIYWHVYVSLCVYQCIYHYVSEYVSLAREAMCLCRLWSVSSQVRYLISLGLSFLICKVWRLDQMARKAPLALDLFQP